MSTWKKLLVANLGGLAGIVLSLFIVPPKTPLWIWTSISACVLLVFNYVALTYKPKRDGRRNSVWSTVTIAMGFGMLLLELALRVLRH